MIPVRVHPNVPGVDYDYNNSTLAPPPTPVSPNSSVPDGGPSFIPTLNLNQQNQISSSATQPATSTTTATAITANGRTSTTGAQTPGASTSNISVVEQQKSRFHIIKINTGPCKRGRWICTDSDDQIPSLVNKSDVVTIQSAGSGGSSGRPSYHGVPVDDGGFLIPNHEPSIENEMPPASSSTAKFAQNLPAPQAASTPFPHNNSSAAVLNEQQQNFQHNQQQSATNLNLHPSSAFVPINGSNTNLQQQQQTNRPPSFTNSPHEFFAYPQSSDVDLSGASVLFGKILPQQMSGDKIMVQTNSSFDGSTSSSSGNANLVAIDNKIEQAMDLVKTHLLYAVREEVEILKVRIVELEKKVGTLEKENKILREYAPPEILAQLSSTQSSSAAATHAPSQQQLQLQLQQQQQQQQLQLQSSSSEVNNSGGGGGRPNGPLIPKFY